MHIDTHMYIYMYMKHSYKTKIIHTHYKNCTDAGHHLFMDPFRVSPHILRRDDSYTRIYT